MERHRDGISTATSLPPLSTSEERRLDARKWAAIRCGTRLMLEDRAARSMLHAFVKQVLRVVDRAYVLEAGSLTLDGTAEELLKSDEIQKAFMGM